MRVKKVAFLGISVALAMVLSFIELQLAFFIPIYGGSGIKIGLANIVIVFLLYKMGFFEALSVSLVRVVLVSVLFGSLQSFTFGIVGALLSLAGMLVLKKVGKFHYITVSIVGGILHNVGQIVVAALWTQTAQIVIYLPALLVTGIASGAIIGLVAGILLKKLKRLKLK